MPLIGVARGIYLIGGPMLTHMLDANVYLVLSEKRKGVVIDSGTGLGFENMLRNILELGINPFKDIEYVILTHCHIDHAGGASALYYGLGVKTVAHEPDSLFIREGNPDKTLAKKLGLEFKPSPITVNLRKEYETLEVDGMVFEIIHTPGHTQGSISVYFEIHGNKVLALGDAILSEEQTEDFHALKRSLSKILRYDFEIVLGGHDFISKNGRAFIEEFLMKLKVE